MGKPGGKQNMPPILGEEWMWSVGGGERKSDNPD